METKGHSSLYKYFIHVNAILSLTLDYPARHVINKYVVASPSIKVSLLAYLLNLQEKDSIVSFNFASLRSKLNNMINTNLLIPYIIKIYK